MTDSSLENLVRRERELSDRIRKVSTMETKAGNPVVDRENDLRHEHHLTLKAIRAMLPQAV